MGYKDTVFGKLEISDPVVIEIINGPSFERLKGVDCAGYFRPFFHGDSQNRFEHSLGDYILLNKFGAVREEQISGLLHDVSHSAFSHCIDYVLDKGSPEKHNYQDSIFVDFVKKTEIPSILRKYGFAVDYVLNEHNFSLQETELPDLCADRIDYSLRTALLIHEVDQRTVREIVDNLMVLDNKWVFKSLRVAKKYAKLFYVLNRDYFAGFRSALMFRTVGDFLRRAVEKGYVTEGDLYTTDEEVLKKAKKYLQGDKRLMLLWRRMNGKAKYINDPKNFEAHVFCKSRVVDPLILVDNETKRLSSVFPEWKGVASEEMRPKEYFVRFED